MRRLLLALPALIACHPLTPCERVGLVEGSSLELDLGAAEAFERPTPAGAVEDAAWGAQGGRHVWLAVRTTGFWPGERHAFGGDEQVPTFEATLTDAATGETLTTQQWGWTAMDGDELEATLALGELFLPEPGSTTGGSSGDPGPQDVVLEIAAEDDCGVALDAELPFTLRW